MSGAIRARGLDGVVLLSAAAIIMVLLALWAVGCATRLPYVPPPAPTPAVTPAPTPELPPLPPWQTATEADLRSWCGSIATTLWAHESGIRPGRADNALFTAEYMNPAYDATARAQMRAAYPYTHWALNPLVAGGYSGYWGPTDWSATPGAYLDRVAELWQAGKVPVVFALDDTGRWANGRRINREAVERDLTPLYSQPQWQALVRVVALAWEPDYEAADWQWAVRWLARVFPRALRYVHFPSGHGAPGQGYELASNGPYASEAAMWVPVAPYIHGLLLQDTYAFIDAGTPDDGRTNEQQVLYDAADFVRRFRDGYAGWPRVGADGKPVDVVMFEYGSYALFNGGPARFGTFAAAAASSYEMGRQLLDVPGLAGIGDGGPCLVSGDR